MRRSPESSVLLRTTATNQTPSLPPTSTVLGKPAEPPTGTEDPPRKRAIKLRTEMPMELNQTDHSHEEPENNSEAETTGECDEDKQRRNTGQANPLKRKISLSTQDSGTHSDIQHGEISASGFSIAGIDNDGSQAQVEAPFAIPKGIHKQTPVPSDHSSGPPVTINLTEVTPVPEEERTYWADGTPRFTDGLWRRIPLVTNSQGRRGRKRLSFRAE
ncbi:hypothetical protein EV426DRAFT_710892 [Tirmania nivea]|nr:hypothetical protein EV426DRAFT_710892 [Tirmania nivea]